MAALVTYSRVRTGVHYPLDVVAGSIAGNALASHSGSPRSIAWAVAHAEASACCGVRGA